ncbi:hypothetical protein PFLUV_G00128400 [Perca fluviatilis]|uniref:Uncharacterized protein n=1 Tax=Perca fluviatilis TaxID=8168 RepID=A0A6A5EVB9_PERFL|nr:hypothetical protein PFLUV_G00128400 [Perca fluviatilis]
MARSDTTPNENLEPSVFKLSGTKTTACLATGFSRHNKTTTDPKQTYWGIFNKTAPAVRISGDSLYNQVAILSGEADEEQCEKSSPEPCDDTLKPDPKSVNSADLQQKKMTDSHNDFLIK